MNNRNNLKPPLPIPKPIELTPGQVSVVKKLVDAEIDRIEKLDHFEDMNTLGRLLRIQRAIEEYEEKLK